MINRITIENGTLEDLYSILYKYYTVDMSHRIEQIGDRILYVHRDGPEKPNGYFNTSTNTFEIEDKVIGNFIPEEYELYEGPIYHIFPDFNKIKPKPHNFRTNNDSENPVQIHREEILWIKENWAENPNSEEFQILRHNMFEFETVRNPVPMLIEIISKSFSDLILLYEYADTDTYSIRGGRYTYLDGELEQEIYVDDSNEALELLFKLVPESKDKYHLINGTWKRKH